MQNSDNFDKHFMAVLKFFKMKIMRLSVFSIFILHLSANFSYGQLTEIGFQLGAYNYTGDLTQGYSIKNHRPAASVFLRTNISDAVGLKYGIGGGLLHGKHEYLNSSENQMTSISFNTTILEAFGVFEFYFLDYKSKHSRFHWTPYLSAGLGAFTYFGEAAESAGHSRVQPSIPLGIGFKYQVDPRIDIGIEASSRITFFNYLDGIDDNDPIGPDHVYGNKYIFDTYYFIGFTLNYTIFIIPCPYGYD
jgi:hypothetical protein